MSEQGKKHAESAPQGMSNNTSPNSHHAAKADPAANKHPETTDRSSKTLDQEPENINQNHESHKSTSQNRSETTKTTQKLDTPAKSPSLKAQIIAIIITFVVVVLAVLFGILLVTGKGVFHEPGKIIFPTEAEIETDSTPGTTTGPVTEVGQNFINENLRNLELKSDLTISTKTTLEKLEDSPNLVLYQILLPTTDFYDPTISVTPEIAKTKNLVSVWDLTGDQHILAIDNNYYLDTLNSGAFFEYYVLSGDAEDVEKAKSLLEEKIQTFPTSDEILTFAQTGVTALSRGMNRKLDQVKDATFFTEYIGEYLSHFDLTHTSNESSFSAAANDRNICSKPGMIDAITSSGIDIMELTGNHNQDCGDEDAIATIDLYQTLGIKTVGGGKTAEAAAIPLEISEKGTDITLLAYNYSTGGYTTDNTPGANFYTDEKAKADIAAAKERGDFVIVDVQFFECNSYVNTSEDTTCDYANSSAGDQIGFFRKLIGLSADVVVGTAAHQPQTFELYKDGAIYYGLGNLFFDQAWWPGTTRSIILVHYFIDGKHVQTRLVPTVYDQNYQTKLMESPDAEAFLNRLIKVRPAQD